MKTKFVVLGIILQIFGTTHSLIIPDELPSLLSVIYSNIPTIKKGTDSRIGWGFRFGDRADFQVLVELGPQTNTQPLGNQDTSSSNKRNVLNNLSNTLYAQQKQIKKEHAREPVTRTSNTDGGKWLNQWSENIKSTQQARQPSVLPQLPTGAKPGLGVGEIDAKSVIPDDSTLALRELYKKEEKDKQENVTSNKKEADRMSFAEKLFGTKVEEIKSTTLKPKTTTSAKDALDNVDMEEDAK
ncbi:hypothetical protein ILUMI_20829 [Ignelater luminosus]|uniref:Secreted protein n=1 Tax=Ignelater luminosus TaxID=2038154 RepID=A0A8K0FYK0_IGNLU|nr:hypothetical protein ILUMI_20829 [Ignelater luminosus]